MKKVFLYLVIGLVVLLIAISVGVGLFIGPIIKTGVETLGPKITQVSIKLDAVDVSLLSGAAVIKGLVVGNPEGYKTPEAIRLGKASVSIDPMSVTSSKIVVKSIRVESPEITFDGGLSGNNISKILANVNSVAAKPESEQPKSAAPEKSKDAAEKPAPKIQVDEFLITGAKVHVRLNAVVASQDMTVPLPDIHLKDLGKGTEGITPAELVRVVLTQVNVATMKAVTESVAKSGKVLEDIGKGVSKESVETIKGIGKDLGGLFKK